MDRQKPPISRPKPGRWSWRGYALAAVAVIILAPIVAVWVFIAQFNPSRYAAQMAEAIQRATGRTLTISGPIHLQFSLTPSLVARDLTLSNPAGFTDPAFLTLEQVQARVALLPLLHHQLDILDLKLVRPTLYLERNANGQADWIFSPPKPGSASDAGSATTAPHKGYKIALESVSLENGQLIFRPAPSQRPIIMQLSSLTGQATGLDTPLHLSGSAVVGTTPLTLHGVVGPVAGLTQATPSPWPVDLTIAFAGATAAIQGQIAQPREMRGYDLHVTAHIPTLETLDTALLPAWPRGKALPPLHDIVANLTMQGQAPSLSALHDLTITAGASDLSSLWPGLSLTKLTASLPALNAVGSLSANGAISQLPWQIQAHWNGLDGFFPPASAAANVVNDSFTGDLTMQMGEATASLQGGLATPRSLSGAAWALMLNIPDLSALSPAWGTKLPAWKHIILKTTLTDPGGQGLLSAIALNNLTATMDDARFGGRASLTLGTRPDLDASLNISQADLDSLLAAMPSGAAQPAATPSPSASSGQQQTTQTPTLPLAWLRRMDADITLNADQLVYGHTSYTALQTHAVLKNGLLSIAPFDVQSPGGAVTATGTIDANVEPAAETLTLKAPALALGPLLQTFHLPADAQGTVQAQMDLSTHGDDWAAMLGAVSGRLGLASVNAEIDGAALAPLLGNALQSVGLPVALISTPGAVPVRCMALRLDALDGSGTVRAFGFDSSRLLLTGGGTVNFASRALALVLAPHVRVGGTNMVVPIAVSGTFASPHYGIASAAALAAAARMSVGLMDTAGQAGSGSDSILSQVANALTGHASPSPDICDSVLSLARMGQAGPAPRPLAAASSSTTSPPASGPRSLLNALLSQ